MKVRSALILGIALLFGTMAFAQDYDHKIEITGDYSYVHANPQNNNIIPTFSLNGGGGSGAFYFSKYIGIAGEFEGYGSYTHNINTSLGPLSASAISSLTMLVRSLNTGHHISNHLRYCSAGRTVIFMGVFTAPALAAPFSANLRVTMRLISSLAAGSTFCSENTLPLDQQRLIIC